MNVQTCLVFAMCLVTLVRVQAELELGVDPRESSGVKVSVSSVRNRTARHWISQVCLRHSDDESSESAPWSVDVEPSSSSCSGTKSSLQVKLVFTVPDLPCSDEVNDLSTQDPSEVDVPSPFSKNPWSYNPSTYQSIFQRVTDIPTTTSITQQSTTAPASTSTPTTTSTPSTTSTPTTTSTPFTTSAPTELSGPEMAKRMTIGTRVVRGQDWRWGGQDGKPPGVGTITGNATTPGWIRVRWADNTSNDYRMGELGYDLKLYEMN